uniref:FH2 domain-containing protein n=1 Tax=Macrostomum lignano TaxID=282301 RepID=A0A1I8F3X1_9PLAT
MELYASLRFATGSTHNCERFFEQLMLQHQQQQQCFRSQLLMTVKARERRQRHRGQRLHPLVPELAPTRPNGVSSSGQLTSPTTTTVAAMMKEFADSAEAAGPPGPPKQSDNEKRSNEDFANKFSQLMQPEAPRPAAKADRVSARR